MRLISPGAGVWIAAVLAGAGVLAGESPPAVPRQAAHPEQVGQWVKDLNSDRFLDRELATEKLIAAGAEAIAPLAAALAGANHEVTTRGIYVLRELALAGEPDTEAAARAALSRLATPRATPAARRAAEALDKLDGIRQERALLELRHLGAVVGADSIEFGAQIVDRYALVFGDKWHGEEKDLARLRWLRDVSELIFEGPQVTDEWLKHVAAVPAVNHLTIKRATITDRGLQQLRPLRNLQTLSLLYVPIGDAAVDTLRQLPGLATVRIFGTNLTPPAAERLQQSLVSTKVDVRFGGFLGIGCQAAQEGCVIYTVRPNSAAEKGGLMPNDILYEYQGQRVNDFEVLTRLIGKNKAGDTVSLKILRGDERLEKKITLGEWE
jgi:hypothetical protein